MVKFHIHWYTTIYWNQWDMTYVKVCRCGKEKKWI